MSHEQSLTDVVNDVLNELACIIDVLAAAEGSDLDEDGEVSEMLNALNQAHETIWIISQNALSDDDDDLTTDSEPS